MPRPVDHEKKAALREAAANYILVHGLIDFSLRPLAAALDTSARMLIHHFGSREALLRDAVTTIRDREAAHFRAWLKRHPAQAPTLSTLLRWHWRRLSAPRARPAVRFFLEMSILALRDPAGPAWMLGTPLGYWREWKEEWEGRPGRETRRPDTAREPGDARGRPHDEVETLILATLRGLLLDLVATGDRRRIERAFDAFAARIAADEGL